MAARADIMNCGEFEARIGDYIDGAVRSRDVPAFDEHAAACARCRGLAADLRAIREAARALPRVEAPPAVWSRVEASMARRQQPVLARVFAVQPLGAAAAALLLIAGLAWIGARLQPLSAPVAGVAVGARATGAADPIADAEARYTKAITGLERIAAAERDALDPATAGVLQANLTVIDEAIVESRAALTSEPGSPFAIESLFEALRIKLALLQDMVALINEMRKGNPEGAARIISESNDVRSPAGQ